MCDREEKYKKGGRHVTTLTTECHLASLSLPPSLSHRAPPTLDIAGREKCSKGEQAIRTCGSCHLMLTPSVFTFLFFTSYPPPRCILLFLIWSHFFLPPSTITFHDLMRDVCNPFVIVIKTCLCACLQPTCFIVRN